VSAVRRIVVGVHRSLGRLQALRRAAGRYFDRALPPGPRLLPVPRGTALGADGRARAPHEIR
jgi:hypothetical protein